MTLLERWWSKVEKQRWNQCWPWTAYKDRDGYGQIYNKSKLMYAHRQGFELLVRPLRSGECVLHKCDNPSCCNPRHWFVGSRADNVLDMIEKGRHYNNLKIACPLGHPYDRILLGERRCKVCNRQAMKDYRLRLKNKKLNTQEKKL